jgi:hypothetical protein
MPNNFTLISTEVYSVFNVLQIHTARNKQGFVNKEGA